MQETLRKKKNEKTMYVLLHYIIVECVLMLTAIFTWTRTYDTKKYNKANVFNLGDKILI